MDTTMEYAFQVCGPNQSWETAICRGFSALYALPYLEDPEITCLLNNSAIPNELDPQTLPLALRRFRGKIYGLLMIVGLNEDDTERATLAYFPGSQFLILKFPDYDAPNEISERLLNAVRQAFHLT